MGGIKSLNPCFTGSPVENIDSGRENQESVLCKHGICNTCHSELCPQVWCMDYRE